MTTKGILDAAKRLSITQNVSIQVIDQKTGQVVQESCGHNSATNSLLFGIAHHLIGDFMPNERYGLNPGYSMLSNYVPRYISLGTMGLVNQDQDRYGLPAGIGDEIPDSSDPEYQALLEALNEAKEALDETEAALADECPYYPATTACESCRVCSDRIDAKKQARDRAQQNYNDAYDNLMAYNEEARFVGYMKHTPGYGADGYDRNQNNGREYFGLGFPYTSYDVVDHYVAYSGAHDADIVMYKGLLYRCIQDTPNPAREFDPTYWDELPESDQPCYHKTINMELISPTFPRTEISYRDVVPESEAEKPKTIDIVYSALISTGALAQFREEDKDYVFITEAGLWSKKTWTTGDENGLLAGYRIGPPNEDNWDMKIPENRQILKENILKVGVNQVVQVVWKIQIGSIDEFVKGASGSDQPVYQDIYFTTGLQSVDPLNKLILEKLSYDTGYVYFEQSDVPRGCRADEIMQCDEHLYMDFVVNADGTQTIYWYTEEGEVNYRTRISSPFNDLHMLTEDMSKWHFLGVDFTYLPDSTSISRFATPNEHGFNDAYRRLFDTGYTTDTRSSNAKSGSDVNVFYEYSHSGSKIEVEYIGEDIYSIQDFIDYPYTYEVSTSIPEYPVYCTGYQLSFDYYYCPDEGLGFLNDQNFKDVVNAVYTAFYDEQFGHEMDLSGWDYSRLSDLSFAFSNKPNSSWMLWGIGDAELTNTSHMFESVNGYFYGISNSYDSELPGLSDAMEHVVDASYMFAEATFENSYEVKLFSGDWRFYNIEDANHMFYKTRVNMDYTDSSLNLVFENTSNKIIDASYMFASIYGYDDGDYVYSDMFPTFYSLANMSHMYDSSQILMDSGRSFHVDFEYCTDATYMFANATSLGYSICIFDNSDYHAFDNLTSFSHMFYDFNGKGALSENAGADIYGDELNFSSITDMSYMFARERFEDHDVLVYNSYERPSDQYISSTINFIVGSHNAEHVTGYSVGWDTSNVTNFSHMFENRGMLYTPLLDLDCTSGVNFDSMFKGAWGGFNYDERDSGVMSPDGLGSYLISYPYQEYDPDTGYSTGVESMQISSNATSMHAMFAGAQGFIFPLDLSKWDVRNVTNVEEMFKEFFATSPYRRVSDYEYAEQNTHLYSYHYLRSYQTPEIFYLTLPPINFSILTNYQYGMFDCEVPKVVMNNVHVDSVATLTKIKSFFAGNKCYVLEAKNWTFDSSITDLSNLFSDWKRLCAIDLSGWDVSHITNFDRMFKRNPQVESATAKYAGIIDYSSLDDWDISSGTSFIEMCNSNLHFDMSFNPSNPSQTTNTGVPVDWFEEEPYENGYRFPNWEGTWDTSGLVQLQDGTYSFDNTYTYNDPIPHADFGTFIPTQPSRYVTLSPSGINQLRTASGGSNNRSLSKGETKSSADTKFISLQTGYQSDLLVYTDPQNDMEYWTDFTAEEFKEHAQYRLDTTNPNVDVYYDGELYWCDYDLQFSDLTNFSQIVDALGSKDVSFMNWSADNLTSLDSVFYGHSFRSLLLGLVDTENLTSLNGTFQDMSTGYLYEISDINISSVTNLNSTFRDLGDPGYFFIDDNLRNWDTSAVTSMNYTFSHSCVPAPSDWNTSNVTSMKGVFAHNLTPIDVNWDTSNVTNMSEMLMYTTFAQIIGMDTSSATDMSYMLMHSQSQEEYIGIETWDVSHVTNMSHMFDYATFPYGEPDFQYWDVSNVVDMSYMFVGSGYSGADEYAGIVDYTGIEHWDVSNVDNFSGMFENGYNTRHEVPAAILQWDISNGSSFDYMFRGDTFTNISSNDLVNWFNPNGYFTCSHMFQSANLPTTYVQADDEYVFDISSWGMMNCKDASAMFSDSYGANTIILPTSLYLIESHETGGAFEDFFAESDISKLVWNDMSIYSTDVEGLKEILSVTDHSDIDYNCPRFEEVVATDWTLGYENDSHGVNISNLFSDLCYLRTVNLSGWNVRGVNNFSGMFYKPDNDRPGVLDFSSLDDWTNINMDADFTRMCASNLDNDGNDDYEAFEQGFRFPNWSGGTWDTSDLQQVHIDQANYPYYYQRAGYKEYDAYCFGTEVKSGTTFLINKPPANSTFGTFIPNLPTDWTYDWRLDSSLIDIAQDAQLKFVENDNVTETTTPPTGVYISGTGIIMDDNLATQYPVRIPGNMLKVGTILEMDFTHFETNWTDFGGDFVLCTEDPDGVSYGNISWSYDDESREWFLNSSYEYDPEQPYRWNIDWTSITNNQIFANSTMRLECVESANHYTQWKLYKNGTLLYTSPELMNSEPFLPPQTLISGYKWAFTPNTLHDVIITGIRVHVPEEPAVWDFNWNLTSSLTDSVKSQPLMFNDGTTTPDSGQYTQGTGIVNNNGNGKAISLPINLMIPGSKLEIDFTHMTMYNSDTPTNLIVGHNSNSDYVGFGTDSEDTDNWFFSADWFQYPDGGGYVEHVGYTDLGISGYSYFANSTLRIVTMSDANGRLRWKIYKGAKLIKTTPALGYNSCTFLPLDDLSWIFEIPALNMEDAIITGIRIQQGSQWDYNWDLTTSLTDTIQSKQLEYEETSSGTAQLVQGVGLELDSDSGSPVLDVDIFVPNTIIEMDFTTCDVGSGVNGQFINSIYGYSISYYSPHDLYPWDLEIHWKDDSDVQHGDTCELTNVVGGTFWQNSTIRLESALHQNRLVYNLYKNGVLLYTTPDYDENDRILLPMKPSVVYSEHSYFNSSGITAVTITGIRLKQGTGQSQ